MIMKRELVWQDVHRAHFSDLKQDASEFVENIE